MSKSCLICYERLDHGEEGYHASCCRKLFGFRQPPLLPYSLDELKDLAKKVIKSQIAVPGVQAKLSLNLERTLKNASRLTLVGLWGDFI